MTPVAMPAIAFVVARSAGGHVIGRDGQLPWRLGTDLTRFRRLTEHHAVIMGRKTFDSIGKPLRNRLNVVVSRSVREKATPADASQTVGAANADDALLHGDVFSYRNGKKTIFVIGGSQIYGLYGHLAERVYLTEVDADVAGDATFDEDFHRGGWSLAEEERVPRGGADDHASVFRVYERRREPRMRFLHELDGHDLPVSA